MRAKFKYLMLAICIVIMVLILSGCDMDEYEEQELLRLEDEERQIAQTTEIPKRTIKFSENIEHSTSGKWHSYTAASTKELIDFLEWLDRDKYFVYQIISDGKYYKQFYVIYKNVEYEAK